MEIGHVEASPVGDDVVLLRLLTGPWVDPARIVLSRGAVHQPYLVGEVEVRYQLDGTDSPPIRSVRLDVVGEPITPAMLRRFSWTRALAAADACLRARTTNSIEDWRTSSAKAHALTGLPIPKQRGRPRLTTEHYQNVADLYLTFTAQGSTKPNADIAERLGVNRNTAAGWVNKARQRGMLPAARPGKAG